MKVDTITPGKLTENGVVLDNNKAGGTGYVTVAFTLDNPLPHDGAIAITFPEGFILNSGEATEASFTNWYEIPSVDVINHTNDGRTTVLIRRLKSSGVPELHEGREVELKLTNIRNPQVSGPTQSFEIRTSRGQ